MFIHIFGITVYLGRLLYYYFLQFRLIINKKINTVSSTICAKKQFIWKVFHKIMSLYSTSFLISQSLEIHGNKTALLKNTPVQGLSQQGVQVSFWHPGPRKIPILGGKDTLSIGQNFLKILITSRYSKSFILKWYLEHLLKK